MNDMGMGTQQMTVAGMIDAAEAGADVISMSFGGKATPEREKIYKEAIDYCRQKGSIVVTSAGNANVSATLNSPASSDQIIVVASCNAKLEKSFFSNTVAEIDWAVSAPGQKILSTHTKGSYKELSGTSMSAPCVSGLAGIFRAFDPDLTDETFFELIHETGSRGKDVDKIGPTIQPAEAFKQFLGQIPLQ